MWETELRGRLGQAKIRKEMQGAREFRLCDEYGDVRFLSPKGEMGKSELFPEFPGHIDIEAA